MFVCLCVFVRVDFNFNTLWMFLCAHALILLDLNLILPAAPHTAAMPPAKCILEMFEEIFSKGILKAGSKSDLSHQRKCFVKS